MLTTLTKPEFQPTITHSNGCNARVKNFGYNTAIFALVVAFVFAALPVDALAQTTSGGDFSVPFLTDFGCKIARWMKGTLAILLFVLVTIATLVIGLISKMDWSKILLVVVIFGIIQAIGVVLVSTGALGNLSNCVT